MCNEGNFILMTQSWDVEGEMSQSGPTFEKFGFFYCRYKYASIFCTGALFLLLSIPGFTRDETGGLINKNLIHQGNMDVLIPTQGTVGNRSILTGCIYETELTLCPELGQYSIIHCPRMRTLYI